MRIRPLWIAGLVLWLACCAGLAACGGQAAPTATPTPRDDSAIRAALAAGPHADTYSLYTGPNTYCARCKSPANWDPNATIDPPPNCVTCKFPGEVELRLAEGNPLVQEHEWEGIRCYNCHPNTELGPVDSAVAWWDPVSDEHVPQERSTQLCEQCHRDTEGGILRRRALAESEAHADFTCTTCHDPHSAEAACADCHNADDTETAFVTACWTPYLAPDAPAPHPDLRCETCHDDAGLEARPVEDEAEPYVGQWATWRSVLIAGSIPSTHVWVSHDLTATVDCSRCHYAENPWGLAAEVERP